MLLSIGCSCNLDEINRDVERRCLLSLSTWLDENTKSTLEPYQIIGARLQKNPPRSIPQRQRICAWWCPWLMIKIEYSGVIFLKKKFSFLKNIKNWFSDFKEKSYNTRSPRSGFIIIKNIFFCLNNTQELVHQAGTRNKWFQPRRSREPQKGTT